MEVLMGKSSINGPFSMAMLNSQMVNVTWVCLKMLRIPMNAMAKNWENAEKIPNGFRCFSLKCSDKATWQSGK
jgi:hypothetical protein